VLDAPGVIALPFAAQCLSVRRDAVPHTARRGEQLLARAAHVREARNRADTMDRLGRAVEHRDVTKNSDLLRYRQDGRAGTQADAPCALQELKKRRTEPTPGKLL